MCKVPIVDSLLYQILEECVNRAIFAAHFKKTSVYLACNRFSIGTVWRDKGIFMYATINGTNQGTAMQWCKHY